MGITTRRTKNHHTWRRGQDFFQGEKDRISFRERRTGFLSGREGQDFFQGEIGFLLERETRFF